MLNLTSTPQTSCFNELLDLASSNQEDGTVGLKQLEGGQHEWDKVGLCNFPTAKLALLFRTSAMHCNVAICHESCRYIVPDM